MLCQELPFANSLVAFLPHPSTETASCLLHPHHDSLRATINHGESVSFVWRARSGIDCYEAHTFTCTCMHRHAHALIDMYMHT